LPFYEKYCFSNIPPTILKLFDIPTQRPILPEELYKDKAENFNKIVFLLIDAFGYKQWLRYYKDYEFFDTFTKEGIVSPLTSVFPSTTAAALTTINTGLTPQEHALFEWILYFREIDMAIITLQFTPLNGKNKDLLLEMGIDPKILYKGNTIYQTLKKAGIKSFAFNNAIYANNAYSKLIQKGSVILPFINLSDLVVRLRKSLETEKGKAYFFVYISDADAIQHKYGVYSEEHTTQLSEISYLLKKEFLEKLQKNVAEETLFIITADHGQINASPKETIYLNKYRRLIKTFQKGKKAPIPPTGGPRDVFLHIKEDKLEKVEAFLSTKLKGKAKIIKTEEAIKVGLFGINKPKKEFYERAGNLMILPYKNYTMWYEHIKGKKLENLGHHGGLTEEEMLVPFGVAKLSELR
jgi:predicted AlkP superfamily pyrophosphatase or phosphodiesterase